MANQEAQWAMEERALQYLRNSGYSSNTRLMLEYARSEAKWLEKYLFHARSCSINLPSSIKFPDCTCLRCKSGPFICRVCKAKCCEHFCSLKDGSTAICGGCKK